MPLLQSVFIVYLQKKHGLKSLSISNKKLWFWSSALKAAIVEKVLLVHPMRKEGKREKNRKAIANPRFELHTNTKNPVSIDVK